jgi:capsular polysaccharide biosynthesis protein
VLIPDPPAEFHLESLEMLGVARERITPFRGAHVVADELIWASPLAPIGFPSTFLIDWLRSSLGRDSDDGSQLYLRRTGARRVANETDVLATLRPRGFDVIDPDRLSFAEQVTIFSGARRLVGSHGAAFSNGIFAPRLDALEFFHAAHINISTVGVLSAAGHAHWTLVCPRVRRLSRPRHHDLRVPIDLLERTLERMDQAEKSQT